eukprot:14955517-Ditylum_brightwellii.AAC.1
MPHGLGLGQVQPHAPTEAIHPLLDDDLSRKMCYIKNNPPLAASILMQMTRECKDSAFDAPCWTA